MSALTFAMSLASHNLEGHKTGEWWAHCGLLLAYPDAAEH